MEASGHHSHKISRLQCWSSATSGQVRNKGAILVLIYSFAGSMLLTYLLTCDYCYTGNLKYYNVTVAAIIALFYPLAGWLADVRFGRYKFIKITLAILWVTMVVSVLNEIVNELGYLNSLSETIQIVKYFVIVVALGGFQANIVQLGIDQLFDASSREIVSYISWYIWVFFLSNTIFHIVQSCLCEEYKSIVEILVLFSVSVALLFDYVFCKTLIKEPSSYNPLKLIYEVLLYAKRTKYPRLRSAFTYWEDKRYSRIDLAKSKYGGPFTTEQVEDVKTFFRMVVIIFILSLLMSSVFVLTTVTLRLMLHYRDMDYESECSFTNHYWKNCSNRMFIERFGYSVMVLGIPVFELIISPFCTRVVVFCTIAKKMIAGAVILIASNVSLLVLEIASHTYTQRVAPKMSIPCLFLASSSDVLANRTLSVGYVWLLVPNMMDGLALYVVVKAAIEFLCAQSPYPMKGLLIGITYAMSGLSILLAGILKQPIRQLFKHSHSAYSCGMWYFSSTLLLSIFSLAVIVVLIRWYSRRRRDENIHNEQIFAVDYYDRYIRFNQEDTEQEGEDLRYINSP